MTAALQLYSMRDCADQIALLAELPDFGITTVEGYGGVYGDPAGYRAAMDAHGITMPSGHMALSDIEADFDATLALAKTLGMTRVFAPYLEEKDRPDTTEGWSALGQRLNAAAAKFADHGLTFGWHNHDFEFIALADGGERDPIAYIKRYGDRLSAIHVKDIAAEGMNVDQDGWSDLGAGTLDWAALLQACRDASSDLIYALEHDKPSDPVGYAKRSAAAFATLWETTHG
jgi:sugar phosphate isomerase/epimerase